MRPSRCQGDAHTADVCTLQSLIAMAPPFGFGVDGHVEVGISECYVWHHAGQGVPDPDHKRMGFIITTSEAQPQFNRSKVQSIARSKPALCITMHSGIAFMSAGFKLDVLSHVAGRMCTGRRGHCQTVHH